MKKISITVVLVVMFLTLVGCAPPTTIKVSGLSRDKVVETLWSQGSYQESYQLFDSKQVKVWPSPKIFNDNKTLLEYKVGQFFDTEHIKDTVLINEEAPNTFVISMKSESKSVFLNFLWGLLSFHERDRGREKGVMFDTSITLDILKGVVQWKGRHSFIPIRTANDNSIWLAYNADSFRSIHGYFKNNGFNESYDESRGEWTFSRYLMSGPKQRCRIKNHGACWSGTHKGKPVHPKWETKEEVIVKKVSQADKNSIITVGISAKGIHECPDLFLFLTYSYHNMDDGLRENLFHGITKHLDDNSKTTVFVDPAPWIKQIKLPAYESDWAKKREASKLPKPKPKPKINKNKNKGNLFLRILNGLFK